MKRVQGPGSRVQVIALHANSRNLRYVLLLISFLSFINYHLKPSYAESGNGSMAHAEKLFLEGRYERAASELDSLIKSRARHRDELYYLKGLSELKLKRFGDARRSFETILDEYPRSERTFYAKLGIGDSYYLEGNASRAEAVYNEILKAYPGDRNIAIVHSRLADAGKDQSLSAPETGLYSSVQIGCFKNKRNAEKLAEKLSGEGYEGYIESPVGMSDGLYRVKVGRFGSRQEAENLAARLNAAGYKTKICP